MSRTLSMESVMEIENCLKVWRARQGVSQQQLADETGLSRQTVNAIERGRFVPSALSVLKMARFFETTVEEIFHLVDEDSNDSDQKGRK